MIIAGAMLIGLGVGLALGDAAPGVLIGLGVGILIEGVTGKIGRPFPFGRSKSEE